MGPRYSLAGFGFLWVRAERRSKAPTIRSIGVQACRVR